MKVLRSRTTMVTVTVVELCDCTAVLTSDELPAQRDVGQLLVAHAACVYTPVGARHRT
jgi:hypothetical protein